MATMMIRTPRLPPHANRARKPMPNTISEESDESPCTKSALISSEFVEWSWKQFAQPVSYETEEEAAANDVQSRVYYEREWRFLRNKRCRRDAREEQKKALTARTDYQIFHTRCPQQPDVIAFHPFDSHLAVASKDSFGIWDWQNCVKLTWFAKAARTGTKVTSLNFINAHDVSLLMTASDDGSVRLWKHYWTHLTREANLLTAWQALADVPPATKASSTSRGLVTSWEQRSLTLAVTGDVKAVRLWDAETELKKQDISTGADCGATSLDTDGNGAMMVVGCGDGSVRLFDRRLPPNETRIMTWREHNNWVLGAYLPRGESTRLISGSVSGDIRIFDLRKNSSVNVIQTHTNLTALTLHPAANILACGSLNHSITFYNTTAGQHMTTIKFHEGFMGTRIPPVACLSFHPNRVVIAAGCIDNTITAYGPEIRR